MLHAAAAGDGGDEDEKEEEEEELFYPGRLPNTFFVVLTSI